MSGFISNSFILNLIYTTDIVQVIANEINLKKIGENYKSFCPFHKEKNPSFIVNVKKKFYFCFGCKTHGNVIDFLMNFKNLNFIESVKELANINGVDLIYDKNFCINKNKYKEELFFLLMNKLNNFYNISLLNSIELKYVRNYLFNRGITISTIKYFSIGFSSLYFFKNLLDILSCAEIKFLLKLGFFLKKDNLVCDKLNNRIIFPIKNLFGHIVAFGGRSLNFFSFCKYINSSTNIYFIKKKILYGLNYVKNFIPLNNILVVEGYFDVIVLHQYGVYYTVGLLGSHICDLQIKILFSFTKKIIFCFDGDKTGFEASKKALESSINLVDENHKIYFVFLPKNEDPDSLIRKEGKALFENRLSKAKSIFDFLFSFLENKYSICYFSNKIYVVRYILRLINKVKSSLIKIFLNRKLMFLLGITNLELLNSESFNKNLPKIKNKCNNIKIILRYLIYILVMNPQFSKVINIQDILFNKTNIPNLSLFLNIFYLCLNKNNISTFDIIHFYKGCKIKCYLEILISQNYFMFNRNNMKILFIEYFKYFKNIIITQQLNNLLFKDKNYVFTKKEKEKIWYLIKLKNLTKK